MPRPSYNRRGPKYVRKAKWTVQTQVARITIPTSTAAGANFQNTIISAPYVGTLPGSETTAFALPVKRTFKHLTIQMMADSTNYTTSISVAWGLVRIREGTTIGGLNVLPSTASAFNSLFEPNEDLLASGIINSDDAATTRLRVPYAFSLDSGNRVVLLIAPLTTTNQELIFSAFLRYATKC